MFFCPKLNYVSLSLSRFIIFSGICQFVVKNFKAFQKISKCSYNLAECIFDNPDQKFLLKFRNFAQIVAKIYETIIFLRRILFSPGQVECSFEKPAESFSFKIRKLFVQCQKKLMKRLFFPEKSSF